MASDTLYHGPDSALYDAHHWEDWLELCCIANLDGEVDIAGISDRLREQRATRRDNEPEDDDGEADFSAALDEAEEIEEAAKDDKHFQCVKNWFLSLANRAKTLGEDYPFQLNAENSKLKLRTTISPQHRLYVALLMMANLHHFSTSQSDLTSSFETMGISVFRWLLPNHAEVHRFGKGPDNKGRYTGHIWKKIKKLADDLSCEIKCKKEDFAANDNGDGGLDLVGWVPWKDAAPGRLAILGQCACTPDWAKKQDEASGARWATRLDFVTHPTTVILIPFFLRTSSGAWHRRTDFSGHLVIDRLRLLRTLAGTAAEFSKLPALKHVETCLAAKEGAY